VPGKLNRMITLLPRLLPRGLVLAASGAAWNRQRRQAR